jgi:hypothetical protein
VLIVSTVMESTGASEISEVECNGGGSRNTETAAIEHARQGFNDGWARGYKDGLQPESLADGNWLVKQNQPVSKIETKSDTNLRSLYESRFRNALISKSVIL